jgi:ABC-type multidrug transport system ATPase subunit
MNYDRTIFDPNQKLNRSNVSGNQCIHTFKVHFDDEVNIYEYSGDDRVVLLGRGDYSDIIIMSPIVSRKHFEIHIPSKGCKVVDLGGKNGTFVNRVKIAKEWYLENGDNISIDNSDKSTDSGVLIEYLAVDKSKITSEKTFNLNNKNSVVVGREDKCDITIPHTGISRKHCRFYKQGNDWFVEDLKSTNGTFVNGKKATKLALKNNDSIFVGNTKFTYKQDSLIYTIIENGITLEAVGVSKHVVNSGKKKTIVSDVNFSIKAGEFVAIVGGSGAGKSTLMDCLNGFRPATNGKVVVNGDNFYSNYDAYKEIMGYVPQKDIVYDNLTLRQMLTYSAKLRMPKDSTNLDIKNRVQKVITDVMLDGKEDIKIRKLSGGQKKRASIAIELLAEPKLLFLDEPTSGLDPGMDKSMMKLLKKLSKQGTTIVLITHATTNIVLCDKVVFLGVGGVLCYFGNPKQMNAFFEVDDIADIYMKLSVIEGDSKNGEEELARVANYFNTKLENIDEYSKMKTEVTELKINNTSAVKAKNNSKDYFRQFKILTRRYFKLIFSDRLSLFLMLGQAPLMIFILFLVGEEDSFKSSFKATQILFIIVCMSVLIGILNSFLEICKEREILRREYTANLGLIPYLSSKIFVLGTFSLLQGFILVVGSKAVIEMNDESLMINNGFDFWVTIVIALLSSVSLGILISAYSTSTERATFMMPLAIIPQIVFSGVLFPLDGAVKTISYFITSRWSVQALCSIFNINSLVSNPAQVNELYEHEFSNLFKSWSLMGVFIVGCLILSGIILSRNLKYEK